MIETTDDPHALIVQASAFRLRRRLPEAEMLYRRLMAMRPSDLTVRENLGICLLAQGRLREAWPYYEGRLARRRADEWAKNFAPWRGEPLAGRRLFVWWEQGLGDQIMAARFLPLLRDAHVTYAGPQSLQRLFSHLPVTYQVVGDEARVRDQDFWSLPFSLPGLLGVGEDNLPTAPYLVARPRPSGGRIGVVWRGKPAAGNDVHRSLPPELGLRLLSLPGAISLAPEDTGATDFQDTADIIAGLDLVISVDTSVAHLTGALGKPLWLLHPAHSWAWPWPEENPSLWHQSARIFRQPEPGQWGAVIEEVERTVAA